MNWFTISLLAAALFAACNFIDKILISRFFKGGGVGALAIYSALIGFIVVPFGLLFNIDYFSPGAAVIAIMFFSGVGYLLGVIPYLYALTQDDTSTVVPIFQTIPLFSFILGYFFLNESITWLQFLGMMLLIIGSIVITTELTGGRIKFKWKTTVLMLGASLLISISNFLFKFVGVDYGFIITSFWTYMGYAVLGLLLLFISSYRRQFFESLKVNSVQIIGINTLNEVLSVGGKMLQNFATLLAPLALAVSVQGFQPIFAIIFGIFLTLFFPKLLKEDIRMNHLFLKITSIAIIFIGGYLIN